MRRMNRRRKDDKKRKKESKGERGWRRSIKKRRALNLSLLTTLIKVLHQKVK